MFLATRMLKILEIRTAYVILEVLLEKVKTNYENSIIRNFDPINRIFIFSTISSKIVTWNEVENIQKTVRL